MQITRQRGGNRAVQGPQTARLVMLVATHLSQGLDLPAGSVDGSIAPLMASPPMTGESVVGVALI
jgi:uncharacterized protein (UPF0210 family)